MSSNFTNQVLDEYGLPIIPANRQKVQKTKQRAHVSGGGGEEIVHKAIREEARAAFMDSMAKKK